MYVSRHEGYLLKSDETVLSTPLSNTPVYCASLIRHVLLMQTEDGILTDNVGVWKFNRFGAIGWTGEWANGIDWWSAFPVPRG